MKPKHVGIIMDGNRRLARRMMKEPWKGHEWGKEKLSKVVEWCEELEIPELTVYAFSMQNFNRPKKEFNYLMKLFKEYSEELLERMDEINEKGLRINFVGRIKEFPEEVWSNMEEIMKLTKNNEERTLNVAVAYGGREELVDAIKKITLEVESGGLVSKQITEQVIAENLYVESEPDMIIRTGGERRTSNFMIWQASYAEWFFLEKMWPEFEKEDFVGCIEEFGNRDRRFGQ